MYHYNKTRSRRPDRQSTRSIKRGSDPPLVRKQRVHADTDPLPVKRRDTTPLLPKSAIEPNTTAPLKTR